MTEKPSGKLNCTLIGPGNFGRSLAQALMEDQRAHLAGVLGATPGESAAGAATLGGRAFASLDELLAAGDVGAVLIATPSDTHAQLAIKAARAGKQVFCEKPMALTVAECAAMIAAARQAGVALMIGQVQRFFPLLAEARRIVHSRALGRPISALVYRNDLLQRQAGSWLQKRARVGGLLHQTCVHELDWLRTLLGEVAEVFARAGSANIQAGLDFPDAVELSLRFADGAVATLSTCMTSYVQQHGGAIYGASGTLKFDMHAGTLAWRDRHGAGAELRQDDFAIGAGHQVALRAELRAFVDAALDNRPVLISGDEGRANIEVIQAALISIAERRPVALPLPESEQARRAYLEI